MKGTRVLIAVKCATAVKSITSCTEDSASIAQPAARAAITSWWSPKIAKACAANARAATWNTPGSNSPATLYKLGSINNKPWEDVKVVVNAPACKEP